MLKYLFCLVQRHICCPNWIFDRPTIRQKLKFLVLMRKLLVRIASFVCHPMFQIASFACHLLFWIASFVCLLLFQIPLLCASLFQGILVFVWLWDYPIMTEITQNLQITLISQKQGNSTSLFHITGVMTTYMSLNSSKWVF